MRVAGKSNHRPSRKPIRSVIPLGAFDPDTRYRNATATMLRLPVPPMARLVAAFLADSCGQNGYTWQREATIAAKLNVSESSVRRALRSLVVGKGDESIGILYMDKRERRSSIYTFVMCDTLEEIEKADPSLRRSNVGATGQIRQSDRSNPTERPVKSGGRDRSNPTVVGADLTAHEPYNTEPSKLEPSKSEPSLSNLNQAERDRRPESREDLAADECTNEELKCATDEVDWDEVDALEAQDEVDDLEIRWEGCAERVRGPAYKVCWSRRERAHVSDLLDSWEPDELKIAFDYLWLSWPKLQQRFGARATPDPTVALLASQGALISEALHFGAMSLPADKPVPEPALVQSYDLV